MADDSRFSRHEGAFFQWARRLAERFVAREGELAKSIGAHDLLMAVWMRPAFLAERRTWELREDGEPRLPGGRAGPRAFLLTALRHELRSEARKRRLRGERLRQLEPPVAEAPPTPPDTDCASRCLDEMLRRNPIHAWLWYCTHVQRMRDPGELARQSGLAKGSIHKLAARVDARMKTCVAECEAGRRGGR